MRFLNSFCAVRAPGLGRDIVESYAGFQVVTYSHLSNNRVVIFALVVVSSKEEIQIEECEYGHDDAEHCAGHDVSRMMLVVDDTRQGSKSG